MPRLSRIPYVLALFFSLAAPAFAADEFFFHKGDRVMFLGDSITEQYQYSNDIELYLTTRFPTWGLSFLNAGISGDTATGGAGRFATHVLAEKPTALTINFGMNDGGYGAFNPAGNANFVKNTEAMLVAAKAAGVRVGLVSPNAVDRRFSPEKFNLYLETQKQFYAPLKELAAKNGAEFADQYAITRMALERIQKDDAKEVIPFYDGFHTAPPGGLFMAHAILTGLHAPALVSQVTIDVIGGKAQAEGCTVEKLEADPAAVDFDRLDQALPIPVQTNWVTVLPYVNDLKDLNWYGLKATGLASGKYSLAIDGKDVGQFTAEQLAAGVNLGNLTTGPIHDQGQKVFDAINAKNVIVHDRFRKVLMFQPPEWLAAAAAELKPKEMARLLNVIAEKQADIYKLAQPVPHHFSLKAVK